MNYLFTQFNKIEELLRNRFILLLLDYDGTLTPIVETPQDAIISKETKELLQRLSKKSNYALGIISGRSLEDIKNTVGVKDIIYAGNHGLEIEGPSIKFKSWVSLRIKSVIHRIADDMRKRLSKIKGVLIEDKELTLSIHYRLVGKKDMPVFEKIISEVTASYTDKIKVDCGKKVYEIKPAVKWDKGRVVLWLLSRKQFSFDKKRILPIYLGDDTTDEEAFKALKRKGLTIFVGKSHTSGADYYLRNTQEVVRFLHLISEIHHN
ncbi:MAG: trehalose-phosphatase [bacterium]